MVVQPVGLGQRRPEVAGAVEVVVVEERGVPEAEVAVEHLADRRLPAGENQIAGSNAQQDQNSATDELLTTNGIVGNDGIVALTESLEFGGALHQFPLRRRRLALSSSTGPRIAGSGAAKSGFLRLKIQIH